MTQIILANKQRKKKKKNKKQKKKRKILQVIRLLIWWSISFSTIGLLAIFFSEIPRCIELALSHNKQWSEWLVHTTANLMTKSQH